MRPIAPTCPAIVVTKRSTLSGFALENFDPIGQWRETYESGIKVETYGQLPDGERFDDIRGLA